MLTRSRRPPTEGPGLVGGVTSYNLIWRESPMKILVIGGTGHVGSEVVKELKERDADVRVLARKADEKSLPGVEMVVGDLLDPVSIEKAMKDVDKMYLLNAVTPEALSQ